jgi:hypothetical protein
MLVEWTSESNPQDYGDYISILRIPIPRRKIHLSQKYSSCIMRSRDDILKQLQQHLRVLAQKYHVQRIGVFGSVSRGTRLREVILIFSSNFHGLWDFFVP